MVGLLYILIFLLLVLLVCYTWGLRSELVHSEYWKILPKGPEYFGICLPIALFILLSTEKVGVLLSIIFDIQDMLKRKKK